jgi:hypothetical protein
MEEREYELPGLFPSSTHLLKLSHFITYLLVLPPVSMKGLRNLQSSQLRGTSRDRWLKFKQLAKTLSAINYSPGELKASLWVPKRNIYANLYSRGSCILHRRSTIP